MANNTKSTRKSRNPVAPKNDAALEAEILANEKAAPSIIDHHTQMGSWLDTYTAQNAVADEPERISVEQIEPLVPATIHAPNDEPIFVDKTDSTMPMGPNGNELVDQMEALSFDKLPEVSVPVIETTDHLSASDLAALEVLEMNEAPVIETSTETPAEAPVIEPIVENQSETEAKRFADIVASFDKTEVRETAKMIGAELDARTAFQKEKNPENTSIIKSLTAARKELATRRAAKLLMATNVNPDFINRSIHDGSRYNVYAFGKLADLARVLIDGAAIGNAINRAVVKSLFSCKKNGVTFTLELAKAAASDKIRVADPTAAKSLFRHTVSASTAPTQASSTMQALETLGVVRVVGSRRNPTYEITSNPVSQHLEELLSASAAA